MGLTEKANDFPATRNRPSFLGLGRLDVLDGDQVEHDWDQSSVLDAFVSGRRIVDGDARPKNLPRFEAIAGRVETLEQLVDLVGEKSADRRTENSWKLGVEEMTQRTLEGLATAGVVGVPALGRTHAHG
jgi:hypothetical protein